MMLVYILIWVEIENDARITFQNAGHVTPPAWRMGGCRHHQQQEQPKAAVPVLPSQCTCLSKASRFCFAAWAMLLSPDKVPGWFGGVHREDLAVAGLFMKACFLGETSYRFCCRLPQRCTEKNNRKIDNYGKQHFTGFIIFRIIGINLLMDDDTTKSCGKVCAGRKCCSAPWGT